MSKPLVVFLMALVGLLGSVRALAQAETTSTESSYKEWLAINVGSGPSNDLHFGMSYNFGWRHFFQVAVNQNEEFLILGTQGKGETALNVSAGARVSFRYVVASIFVGPAVVIAHDPEPNPINVHDSQQEPSQIHKYI